MKYGVFCFVNELSCVTYWNIAIQEQHTKHDQTLPDHSQYLQKGCKRPNQTLRFMSAIFPLVLNVWCV